MKKLLSFALSIVMLFTVVQAQLYVNATELSANTTSQNGEQHFNSFEEMSNFVTNLFTDNYDAIYENVELLREGITTDKSVSFLYQNCGPYSEAFQRELIDYGVYAQCRTNAIFTGTSAHHGNHEYNLYNISFDNEPKHYVFDTTYRQFLRDSIRSMLLETHTEVTDNLIDETILGYDLPEVLIFDLNNRQEAVDIINSAFGDDADKISTEFIYTMYETQVYPEPDLQMTNTLTLTPEDKLRLMYGENSAKPYTKDLHINLSVNGVNYNQEMLYVGNGIYESYFEFDYTTDLSKTNTIQILDNNDNLVFGLLNGITLQTISPLSYYNSTPQFFLTNNVDTNYTIPVDLGGTSIFTVRIDTNASVQNPLIRVLPSQYSSGKYGNVKEEIGYSEVSVKDVLILQQYLVNKLSFKEFQISRANVNGDNIVNTNDVLSIMKHLARLEDSSNYLVGLECYRNAEPYSLIN